jgi:hypothetical protein
MLVLHFKDSDCVVAHRSDRCSSLVRPVWCCSSSVFGSPVLALWINQGTQFDFGSDPIEPESENNTTEEPRGPYV